HGSRWRLSATCKGSITERKLQTIRVFHKTVGELGRELERLVLADPMLDGEHREETAIDPPRDVVARGNRQERAGVVVESDGVREARGFRRLLAEAQHAFGAVEEPPRGAELEDRVVAGERRELSRIDRLVEGKQDHGQVALVAETVEQRLQPA